MKYLLGSKFWKMNIDSSDNDYLQFVFPTKEDLFKGKFKSECCKINNDDINISYCSPFIIICEEKLFSYTLLNIYHYLRFVNSFLKNI